MDSEILAILQCPISRGPLRLATPGELGVINAQIRNATLRRRDGSLMEGELTECLLCESAGLCYPVRDDLPVLLADEAFDLPQQNADIAG
jgi:uncharacterized protein YbaR (Trm112 family)